MLIMLFINLFFKFFLTPSQDDLNHHPEFPYKRSFKSFYRNSAALFQ